MHAITLTLLVLLGAEPDAAAAGKPLQPGETLKLFDGKSLAGWKVPQIGGEGEVHVDDGKLVLEIGDNMTAVALADGARMPKIDYEVSLEAMRMAGSDFFCGLTFPVGEAPCSFIVGGWGGATVGISSLDDADASENETTTYQSFDDNRWYKIRLRVTGKKINAWIDDKQVVDVVHAGRKISIRSEVEECRPLGIATWVTKAGLRKIDVRKLSAEEAAKESKSEPVKK